MAFKVSSSRLIAHTKLMERSLLAIKHLQKYNNNKILYPELIEDLVKEIQETKEMYGLEEFNEWSGIQGGT